MKMNTLEEQLTGISHVKVPKKTFSIARALVIITVVVGGVMNVKPSVFNVYDPSKKSMVFDNNRALIASYATAIPLIFLTEYMISE